MADHTGGANDRDRAIRQREAVLRACGLNGANGGPGRQTVAAGYRLSWWLAQREPAISDDRAEASQSDHLGAALAGQIDRGLHERNGGVAREGEKLRRHLRQHDKLTVGNTAVRGLDSELVEWKRFDKFGDA